MAGGGKLWGALGALLLLPACSSGNGGAAGLDGGGDATADVGAGCTTLVPDGAPTVSDTLLPSSPPPEAPVGGTITDGVYFRTANTFYVASTCTLLPGVPAATAVRLTVTSATAGLIDLAQGAMVPGEQHLGVTSSSYTVAGTTMTRTVRCYTLDGADGTTLSGSRIHAGDVLSSSYTATPTELRLYTALGSPSDGGASCGTEVEVFQKQ